MDNKHGKKQHIKTAEKHMEGVGIKPRIESENHKPQKHSEIAEQGKNETDNDGQNATVRIELFKLPANLRSLAHILKRLVARDLSVIAYTYVKFHALTDVISVLLHYFPAHSR